MGERPVELHAPTDPTLEDIERMIKTKVQSIDNVYKAELSNVFHAKL